jgi:hypothetical protein
MSIGKPFPKGVSGNPGGRSKALDEIRQLAQEHSKDAIKRLAEWMLSDNPKASVAAAQALLDRGYGKPTQAVEMSGTLTFEDQLERIRERARRGVSDGADDGPGDVCQGLSGDPN